MAEGGFLPPIIAELRASTAEFHAKMQEAKAEVAEFEATSTSSFNRLASQGKVALLGLGVAAVAVGAISIKNQIEQEQSHARLVQAIKATGMAYDDYKEEIESVSSKSRQLGFSDNEVENSLARLTTATHDTKKAVGEMGLAEDIARARHIDLQAATDILVKVEGGRYSLLGRMLGIGKDQIEQLHSSKDAVQLLTDLYGGNAQAYSETFAGKMHVIAAEAEYVSEKIGAVLIPIIEEMGTVLVDGIEFLDKNRAAAYALGTIIGGYLVISIGAFLATKVAAFATSMAESFTGLIAKITVLGTELPIVTAGQVAYAEAAAAATTALAAEEAAQATQVAATLALAEAEQALTLAEYEAATGALTEAEAMGLIAGAEGAVTAATYELVIADEALAVASAEAAAAQLAEAGAADAAFVATAGLGVGMAALAVALPVAAILGTAYALGYFNDIQSGVNVGLIEHRRHLGELDEQLGSLAAQEQRLSDRVKEYKESSDYASKATREQAINALNLNGDLQILQAKHKDLTEDTKKLAESNLQAARNLRDEAVAAGLSEAQISRMSNAINHVEEAQKKKIQAEAAASIAEEDHRQKVEAATAALQAKKDAINLTDQALQNMLNSMLSVANAELAASNADLALQGDLINLEKVTKAATEAGGNNAEANLRVAQASNQAEGDIMRMATAHVQQAQKAAEAAGATYTSAQATTDFNNTLAWIAGTLRDTNPQLADYALSLQRVPPRVDTTVALHWSADDLAAAIRAQEGAGVLLGYAEGGIFTSATIGVFGEAGPEAIIPLDNPARAWALLTAGGLVKPMPDSYNGGTVTIPEYGQRPGGDLSGAIDRLSSRLDAMQGGGVQVIVVRSEDEALAMVPDSAKPKVKGAFLHGRKARSG